jgi:hypothetical protein
VNVCQPAQFHIPGGGLLAFTFGFLGKICSKAEVVRMTKLRPLAVFGFCPYAERLSMILTVLILYFLRVKQKVNKKSFDLAPRLELTAIVAICRLMFI